MIVIKISVKFGFFKHDLPSVASVNFSVMSLHILRSHTISTSKADACSSKHLVVSEILKDSC